MNPNINNENEKLDWITEAALKIATGLAGGIYWYDFERDDDYYARLIKIARRIATAIYNDHQRIRLEDYKKRYGEDFTKSFSHSNPEPNTSPPKPEPPKVMVLKEGEVRKRGET